MCIRVHGEQEEYYSTCLYTRKYMAAVPSATVVTFKQDRRCTCISEQVLPVYSIQ